MPGWVIWAIVAVGLALGELATPGLFFLGPVAVAAIVAGVISLLGIAAWLQVLVFLVTALASLGVLRPIARAHLSMPAVTRTGTAALVELARNYAQSSGRLVRSEHTIVFLSTDGGAFGGLGAARFVEHAPFHVVATINLGVFISVEATLSFIGIGVNAGVFTVLSGMLLMSGRFGTLAGVGGPMPHGQPSPSAAGWRVLAGDRTAPGQFNFPDGIAVDAQGNLYVADTGNDRIQKLSATGVPVAEWGGRGGEPGQFRRPEGLVVDDTGGMVVVDADNDRLQRYLPSP